MLNNVPTGINRSARLVTLRHPNAMDCTVYRKVTNRTAGTSMGGMPTIGGLGIMDSEDEADYSYQEIGDARIVFTGQFVAPDNNWNEADTQIGYQDMPVEALIECVLDPSDPAFFVPDSRDMVMVQPGAGIALAYEVKSPVGNVNIPPYTRKYAMQPRSDADVGI